MPLVRPAIAHAAHADGRGDGGGHDPGLRRGGAARPLNAKKPAWAGFFVGIACATSSEWREQGNHLAKDLRAGGDDVALVQVLRLTTEFTDDAARFRDHQGAGGDIPGFQAFFVEAVQAAASDVGQVQRGRAGATHALAAFGHDLVHLQVFVQCAGAAGHVARAQQGVRDAVELGDANAFFVQIGAGALGGREQVVAHRIVDDGLRDDAAMREGDRDAVLGEAVDKVGGAIDRVDDPLIFILVVRVGGSSRFLGQERVVRVGLGQHLDDGLFGRLVDVGDEIVMLFFRDDDAVEVKRGAIDDGGAAAGGFDRRIEHWVHVSFR